MRNKMENKNIETVRENLYLGLINECKKELDVVRSRVGVMLSPSCVESGDKTPNRTELENSLNGLLSEIRMLKNDIIS